MSNFSTRLCEALSARNMTAAELSRKLGINEGTVNIKTVHTNQNNADYNK